MRRVEADSPGNPDIQHIHSRVELGNLDKLELDIAPVVPGTLDMVEAAELPVAAQDNPALVLHIHCSVEQGDFLLPAVVAHCPFAREEHRESKPGETMVPPMNKQARCWSRVRDA